MIKNIIGIVLLTIMSFGMTVSIVEITKGDFVVFDGNYYLNSKDISYIKKDKNGFVVTFDTINNSYVFTMNKQNGYKILKKINALKKE